MSVVSHVTVSTDVQPNGRIYAHLRYTLSDGQVMDLMPRFAPGTDVDAWRAARVPEIEADMAEREADGVLNG